MPSAPMPVDASVDAPDAGFVAHARAAAALWSRVDVMRLSAALAYYGAFSVAPLLVLALGVAALFVNARALEGHVVEQIAGVVGPDVADWISRVLAETSGREGGVAVSIAGVLVLVGATTALAELKAGLDDIVGAPKAGKQSWWSFVRARAFALGLILTVAFLLVVSMFASAALATFASASTDWLGEPLGRAVASEAIVFAGTALLFAAVYAWLPARRLGWRGVAKATLISATLFTAGRWVIGTWLATGEAVSAFGAAGAFAVFLLWMYYSSVVFYTAAVIAVAFGAIGHPGLAAGAPAREDDRARGAVA